MQHFAYPALSHYQSDLICELNYSLQNIRFGIEDEQNPQNSFKKNMVIRIIFYKQFYISPLAFYKII